MNVLSWILFGLITGIIANMLDPHPRENSIFTTIAIGVSGALVGGFIANALFGVTLSRFNVTAFLIAVAGSLLLLGVRRVIRRAE